MTQGRVWFVLLHTRGPAVPDGENVFDQPGIAEHFAFLDWRRADGTMVAAGPFDDVRGEGMTVLDVQSLDVAEKLARTDDQAVVSGVLSVQIRPWRVVMSAD